jgi:acyl carrier protein
MTHDEVVQTVKEFILTRFLPGEDPSALTATTSLISGGILDSLATLEIVSFLEERYGIELEAHEVDPTRIGTLDGMAALVQAKTTARG